MIKRVRWLAVATGLLVSGCASMISGVYQSVQVDSVPQGARVFTSVQDGSRQPALLRRKEVGVTPMTVQITRKDGVVELEKEGYLPARVLLHRTMNPWFLGDVLMTSLLSSAIDSSTGAINEYDPDSYRVELVKDPAWVAPPSSGQPVAVPAPAPPPVDEHGEELEPWIPDVRPLNPPAPATPPAK